MSFQIRGLGRWGVVCGISAVLVGGAGVLSADDGAGRVKLIAQKTQKKVTPKKRGDAMSKDEMSKDEMSKDATGKAATPAQADGMLSFKRDIAPIIVANCMGCHSGNGAGLRNGRLDMTTFEKLMAGGKRGKDIVSGDPDESMLVKMIKGEETPKMPPNNGQRGFSDDAAEKIATWVKQGARLDAGINAADPMAKYAATLEDLRRAELAKLPAEERDKLAEATGRDRWKKASKIEPEVTTTKNGHFLMLSTLPKERATKVLATMETQFNTINKFLSSTRTPALNPGEKISLYVFKDNLAFVEFVRTNENQEVEAGEQARAKLMVETPYIVAVDPANGEAEASTAAPKKSARKKKTEEPVSGPDRTLAAVLTEQLTAAASNKAGKPPRWISLGFGAFLASKVDVPASTYYRALRKETVDNFRIGWTVKAQEALGSEGKTESTRAIGFSLFEWMAANSNPVVISNFIQTMLDGPEKLDDAVGNCLYLNRKEFLDNSGLWLDEKYRRL
jgi:hypothetical protein